MIAKSLAPTVTCRSIFGNDVEVPRASLKFRPTAYALIVHEGNVLVVKVRSTGKLALPGGGVELGERLESALQREVWEETGIDIAVERYLTFRESLFHYDPSGNSYHCYLFYYRCRPLTFTLKSNEEIEDGEAESPHWIPLADLTDENYQGPDGMMQEIHTLLATP